MQFGYGRDSEFNLKQNISYPWIWMSPISVNPQFAVNDVEHYQKSWNITLMFFDKDPFDSTEDPTNLVLDEQDKTIDRFILRLNEWSRVYSQDTVGDVTLRGFIQEPFYKEFAGIHSGWRLRFQMIVPDDFEYCRPENVYVDAADN